LFDDKTKYSDFDSEGKPTTDQEGNALPKVHKFHVIAVLWRLVTCFQSTLKRIAKLFSAQDKLHKQYSKKKEMTSKARFRR